MKIDFKRLNFYGIFCILTIIFFFSFFLITQAEEAPAKGISDWNNQLKSGAEGTKLYKPVEDNKSYDRLIVYLGGVMNFTGFLALMLMARLIWAGYNWMTAGGNNEQVEGAKKTILHATIGIVLLIALYVIAYFVIDRVKFITGYIN